MNTIDKLSKIKEKCTPGYHDYITADGYLDIMNNLKGDLPLQFNLNENGMKMALGLAINNGEKDVNASNTHDLHYMTIKNKNGLNYVKKTIKQWTDEIYNIISMDEGLYDSERENKNPHRSIASKIAWKRHHASYMKGVRERERNELNKSFYAVSKELEEALDNINEAKIQKDDTFNLECEISFDNFAGGVSFSVNPENGEFSISSALNEEGNKNGTYKLETPITNETEYKQLYEEIKQELKQIFDEADKEVQQVIGRHGLKPIQ